MAVIAGCGSPVVTGGSATDVGNAKVSCTVYRQDSAAAAGAFVTMRRRDFLPDTGAAGAKTAVDRYSTFCDATGRFEIDGVDTGDYYIEVAADDSAVVRLSYTAGGYGEETVLPGDTVKPAGMIHGTVGLVNPQQQRRVVVQVYGSERMSVVQADRTYAVTVPAGTHRLRIVTDALAYMPQEVGSVAVAAGGAGAAGVTTIRFGHPLYTHDSLVVR